MSPPVTFGPAAPLSVALVAFTLLALSVVAVGFTLAQYGLGGLTPFGQTIVAPDGTAEIATAAVATRPAASAGRLRCEYLII